MKAWIISIGTELTTGQTVDTNSAWIADRLTRHGVIVVGHSCAPDDADAIAKEILSALSGANWVIVTGGLGPTLDDQTRDALAKALGRPLHFNAEAWQQIQDFLHKRRRPVPESNRVQALIPEGCDGIANPVGTAPGIFFTSGQTRLFALPGVPMEMKVMFESVVEPQIKERSSGAASLAIVQTCGQSEAQIGETLADMMQRGRNPNVGTTASRTIIRVRVIGHGADKSQSDQLVQEDVAEIQRRLGPAVFGEGSDTLEIVVGRLLLQRGETCSIAESCTGGLLAKYLTDVPGSSRYFDRGIVSYANAAKIDLLGVSKAMLDAHGAVSEPVAEAMACGCRTKSGSTWAVATTGVAGPGGGTVEKPVGLVYTAVTDGIKTDVHRLLLGETISREEIRERACRIALNHFRIRLLSAGRQSPE